MKKNLFLSICSLILTSFLLFFLVFGWYVSNKEVTANGIFGSTGGNDYSLTLERATLDKAGNVTGWVTADNMAFNNVAPNNVFLFRMGLESKSQEDVILNVSFDDISSRLTENKLIAKDKKIFFADGEIPLYDIDENNQVMVDNKLLYKVNPKDNTISLGDYQIHNTFMFYDLGTAEPATNKLAPPLKGLELAKVNNYQIKANNQKEYFYFALEFNEEKSLVMQDGVLSSNCYLYQNLVIGHITLRR